MNNFQFENPEQLMLVVRAVVESGYNSELSREFREGLKSTFPGVTPRQAEMLIPWAEAALGHLRQVAAPPAPPAPKKVEKKVEGFSFF